MLDAGQKTAVGDAPNLYFTPTGGVGDDNDYLVWAAATEGGGFPGGSSTRTGRRLAVRLRPAGSGRHSKTQESVSSYNGFSAASSQ